MDNAHERVHIKGANVIGDRLRQARLAAGLTLDALVERLDQPITKQALSKYERGLSQPPASRLNDLAKALGVRVSFLLSEAPARVHWRGFRKHASLPVGEMERLTARAEKRLEDEFSLRELFGIGATHDVPVDSGMPDIDGADAAAEHLRDAWALGDGPIDGLIETVEEHGAIVISWSEDDDRFDGLSGITDDGRPVIVVNAMRAADRIRFDVAHELGHLVMRPLMEERENETLAHRFAAAFLVPKEAVLRELGSHRSALSFPELGLLKQRWGLSMQAWVRRAFDVDVIDRREYQAANIEFRSRHWHRVEPFSFDRIEEPVLLRRLLWRAITERVLTSQQARTVMPELDREPEARLSSRTPTFRDLAHMGAQERRAALVIIGEPSVDLEELADWDAASNDVEQLG